MGMLKDFKDFALKGNVLDLAIGVIIGAAFGKIVSSLVDDILMPPLGLLVGGVDFSNLVVVLKKAELGADGKEIPAVLLKYGSFLQTSFDFLIVAFCVFLLTRALLKLQRGKEEAIDATPAVPQASAEEKLLSEIRDLLKEGSRS